MRLGVSRLAALLTAAAAILGLQAPAAAIPVFAHRYGFTCQVCHTEVPHLTDFGQAFLDNGYRLPGVKPRPTFPIATRIELAYDSSAHSDPNARLPNAFVDEVEFLSGGAVGPRGSYWAEVYAVDGGFPGRARDVWYGSRLSRDGAKVPAFLRAGQFTLELPLEPETFRETPEHYAIWDQTAGDNPFTFFDPKIGLHASLGDSERGLAVNLSALQGHDVGSGLPALGVDTMLALERRFGAFRFSGYRYDGSRPLPGGTDRFWRTGASAGWERGATALDAVYQTGFDANAGEIGALRTSGGFVQVRRELNARTFALARWDATQDLSFGRAVTAGIGRRIARNARLTLFGTVKRDEEGRLQRILTSSLLTAW